MGLLSRALTPTPNPQQVEEQQGKEAFKIIGAIVAERRAKGGALFHIKIV